MLARRCLLCRHGAGSGDPARRHGERRLAACRAKDEGGFDKDDLRFALQSQGLYPSSSELEEALKEARLDTPVALPDMSELIDHLLRNGCKQGLRALPHAWRGISLKQLRALHSAVVESGWLREQHSVPGGGPPTPEDLFVLNTFFLQPVTYPDANARLKLPPRVLHKAKIPPVPEHHCSYAQLVNKEGVDIDYFVSHSWRHEVSRTLSCLQLYAEDVHKSLSKAKPCEVTFWICAFALNQHCVADELGSSPMAAPFNIALMKARAGAVMVLDATAAPLSRIWCLFEVSRASDLERPLHLLTEKGLAGGDCAADNLEARNISEALAQRLRSLSAFEAEASILSDKYAILFHVVEKNLGLPALNTDQTSFVKWLERPPRADLRLDQAVFHSFDLRLRRLLATPLLKLCLKEGRPAGALQYIAMGAQATVSDYQELQGLGQSLRAEVEVHQYGIDGIATLPWLTARTGSAEELGFLLESKGDLDRPASFPGLKGTAGWATEGSTPLIIACHYGHLCAVQVLLQHQAAVDTQDIRGRTALTYASLNAPTASKDATITSRKSEIVGLLLERGASVNLGQGITTTPMHTAGGSGARAIAGLLLERRACVDVRDGEGSTPLHLAALHGQVAGVQFLLSHRADAEAQKKDGSTPLLRAAVAGHKAVVAALLKHGVDVSVCNAAGDTAEDVAVKAGSSELLALFSSSQSCLDS